MRILAMDATLRNTACVLFDNGGLVKAWFVSTKPDRNKWETASEKDQRDVTEWVKQIKAVIKEAGPDVVCAEQSLGGAQSATAAKQLALIAGAMYTLATLSEAGVVWLFTRVYAAKYAALGKKNGSKEEIITAMLGRFPKLEPYVRSSKTGKWTGKAEHYADACANYLACLELDAVKLLQQRRN